LREEGAILWEKWIKLQRIYDSARRKGGECLAKRKKTSPSTRRKKGRTEKKRGFEKGWGGKRTLLPLYNAKGKKKNAGEKVRIRIFLQKERHGEPCKGFS